MWWFSVPAMLKGWFDRVLVNGYAYGTVKAWSGPLTEKRSLLAMTCSYEQAGFRAGGSIGELEPLLRPIQQGTLAYCGFQVLEPFMAYAADEVDDGARASMLESFRSVLRLAVERRFSGGEQAHLRRQPAVRRRGRAVGRRGAAHRCHPVADCVSVIHSPPRYRICTAYVVSRVVSIACIPNLPPGGDDIRVAVLPGFVTRLGDPPVS